MTEKLPLFRSLALPFIVVIVGALALGACSGESVDVNVGQESSAPSTDESTNASATDDAGAESPLTPELTDAQLAMVDSTGLIADVVTDLGADPSNGPAPAFDLGGAVFCGFDIVDDASDGSGEDPAARACFISGVANNVETVLVQSLPGSGSQTVHVYRVDPTRSAVTDHNSADGWAGQVCQDVLAKPAEGPNQFSLAECSSL